MGVGIPHYFQAIQEGIAQAAVRKTAQYQVVEAIGGAYLIAVNTWRVVGGALHGTYAAVIHLFAGDRGNALGYFDRRRFHFGGSLLGSHRDGG